MSRTEKVKLWKKKWRRLEKIRPESLLLRCSPESSQPRWSLSGP